MESEGRNIQLKWENRLPLIFINPTKGVNCQVTNLDAGERGMPIVQVREIR